MNIPKKFTLKINSKYKGLNVHDTINIKKIDGKQCVATVNTGKKEYLLDYNYVAFLYVASNYGLSDFFIDAEKSVCIGMYGIDRHVSNLTDIGLFMYNLDGVNVDSKRYLERLTHE